MSYSFHIFFCICLLILSSVCFSISTRCSVDEAVRPGPRPARRAWGGRVVRPPDSAPLSFHLGLVEVHGALWLQGPCVPGVGRRGPCPLLVMAGLSRGFPQLRPRALGLFLPSSAFGGVLERPL